MNFPNDQAWLGARTAALAAAFLPLSWWLGPAWTLALYVGFNALFNLPHQYCTWVRAVRYGDEAKRRWWALAVLVGGGLALARWGPSALYDAVFTNAMPYWGIWHLAVQHFGISQILRAKGGEPPGRRWWSKGYFLALFALGVLRLHVATELTFRVGDEEARMWRLPVPEAWGEVLGWGLLGLALGLAALRLGEAWRARSFGRLRFEGWTTAATLFAFWGTRDVMIVTASITTLHNLHYIGVVQGMLARELGFAAAPRWRLRHAGLAYGYSVLVHGVFLVWAPLGQVLLASLVAMHYLVDGEIWKLRKDKRLAPALGLEAR